MVVTHFLAEYLLEFRNHIVPNFLFELQLVRLGFQNVLGLENLFFRDRLFDKTHRSYRYYWSE